MFEAVLKFVNLRPLDIKSVIGFNVPGNEGVRTLLQQEIIKCIDKYHGYCRITIQPPYKKRSTGKNSQNHHLNGHITQIANETGNDFETVKMIVKIIAMDNFDYPFTTYKGERLPMSETKCDTVQCAKLIEAVHYLADDMGIFLVEK